MGNKVRDEFSMKYVSPKRSERLEGQKICDSSLQHLLGITSSVLGKQDFTVTVPGPVQ